MRTRALIFLGTIFIITVAAFPQGELTDDEILQRFDDLRFINASSYTFTSDVDAQRPDGNDQATVKLYFKEIDGELYSRIEFLAPPEMIGEIFLTTPEGTFLMTPDLDEPLLISGAQAVFGDTTVVQTVGIPFAEEYMIADRTDTTLEDGRAAVDFELQEAIEGDQTFPTVNVIADVETLTPVRMTVFAVSGDAVNIATFEEYALLDGTEDSYAQRQLIESQLQPTNKTLLTLSQIEAVELSDDLFNPDLLAQDRD